MVLTDLHLGTYVVTEIKSINGYTINPTPKTVNVEYKDQTVKVQYEAATIYNERQRAEVSVIKKDSDTANPLDGGKYTLYAGNDIINFAGQVIVTKVQPYRQLPQAKMERQHTLWICRLQTATIFLRHRHLMVM